MRKNEKKKTHTQNHSEKETVSEITAKIKELVDQDPKKAALVIESWIGSAVATESPRRKRVA